jgi:hypothetical protein
LPAASSERKRFGPILHILRTITLITEQAGHSPPIPNRWKIPISIKDDKKETASQRYRHEGGKINATAPAKICPANRKIMIPRKHITTACRIKTASGARFKGYRAFWSTARSPRLVPHLFSASDATTFANNW